MSTDTQDDAEQPHTEPGSMIAPPAELKETPFAEIQQVGLVEREHACNAWSHNTVMHTCTASKSTQAHTFIHAHRCVGDNTPGAMVAFAPASHQVVTCRDRANPNAVLQNTHGQKLARTRATGAVGYHTDPALCITTQASGTAAAGNVGSPAVKAYGRVRNQCHCHQSLPK